MSKVAFCFPGQGSLEAGMGREIAEAFPAAREVYRIGSDASGLDLEKLCFDTPLDERVVVTASDIAAYREVHATAKERKHPKRTQPH